MKKITILIIIQLVFALILASCANTQSAQQTSTPVTTNTPSAQTATAPTVTPVETTAPIPTLEVTQAIAMYFPTLTEPSLYAAIEVKNTGNTAATIDSISCDFVVGVETVSTEFTPLLNDIDVIGAGKTATFAAWHPYTTETSIPQSSISVTAKVSAAHSDTTHSEQTLSSSNISIEDNYPGFGTVSGTITNPTDTDYSLTLVYLSFYDSSDKLIAVWHFTKNLALPSGESRNFVMHMRTLPISGLSESATRIETRICGIN